MVLDVVVVLAVWSVVGGALALVLSRTVRMRDRREARPRASAGSASPRTQAVGRLLSAG